MQDDYENATEEQLNARMRIAMRVLLRADSNPAQVAWGTYIKKNVEREQIKRAAARGLAQRTGVGAR